MAKPKVILRKVTIQAALDNKNDMHLFVMPQVKTPGNINLTVVNAGQRVAVVVPTTFIPVDMALFTERESLLRDQVFRRLVARGDIAIINSDDANKLIEEHPNAQRELQRILSANSDFDVAKTGDADTVEYIDRRSEQQKTPALVEEEEEKGLDINPFVVGVVNRAAASEDVADIIADIESRFNTLNVQDLEFIVNNVEDATLKQAVMDMIE